MHPTVIIGAGMAAYTLAREIRKHDKLRRLLIVSADGADAYSKPMLSNAFAMGKNAAQLVSHDAAQMAQQVDAEIVAHCRVSGIDRLAGTIATERGTLAYAQLVLAVGAEPIRLALAGQAAQAVLSINHLDDYARLRGELAAIDGAARIVILGAGLIGCEFAEDLSAAGHQLTLVDPNPYPLAALAAPALSRGLLAAWQGRPIAFEAGASALAVERDGEGGLLLSLSNGKCIGADIVLSAVGLRPALGLAHGAGLQTGRGILVDRFGRTSAPDIYALGDCAEYTVDAGGPPSAAPSAASTAVFNYVAPMMTAARAIAATLTGSPTAIELKAEAITVKTPGYKLALFPPPKGLAGNWVDEVDGERTVCRFFDAAGRLRGFGLSHHTLALRQQLLAGLNHGPQ